MDYEPVIQQMKYSENDWSSVVALGDKSRWSVLPIPEVLAPGETLSFRPREVR